MHSVSTAWPSCLRPGCLTSPPRATPWEAGGRCTLSTDSRWCFDILQEDPWRSVLLVPGERFDIWEKCQQEGKVGTSKLSELVLAHVLQSFFAFRSGHTVNLRTSPCSFLNLSGLQLSLCDLSEHRAILKYCYLTWQEQDCRQSPETTPCQWSANRLWDGFTVWDVHALWWPLSIDFTQTKQTSERKHVWSYKISWSQSEVRTLFKFVLRLFYNTAANVWVKSHFL